MHRILVCIIAAIAAHPAAVRAEPSGAGLPLLSSTFHDWGSLAWKPTSSGQRCDPIDARTGTFQRLSMHITTLLPGQAVHAPIRHPHEEAVVVKDGSLEVFLEGRKFAAGPGALIFFASNALHLLTNIGQVPATYYVVDVYTGRPPQPSRPGALGSTIYDCPSLPRTATAAGYRRSIVQAPTATFDQFESHISTLKPGASLGTLTDPADEILLVLEGTVDVTIRTVTARMTAGSFYFQAAGDPHRVVNVGTGPASYQILKFVVPTFSRS